MQTLGIILISPDVLLVLVLCVDKSLPWLHCQGKHWGGTLHIINIYERKGDKNVLK